MIFDPLLANFDWVGTTLSKPYHLSPEIPVHAAMGTLGVDERPLYKDGD